MEKAKDATFRKWVAKEARARVRQGKRKECRRLGLNPDTSSTKSTSLSEEEEEGDDQMVDNDVAYNFFVVSNSTPSLHSLSSAVAVPVV